MCKKKKYCYPVTLFLLCIGGVINLSGCAAPEIRQKSVLQSMVGKSSTEVVRRFGVPTRTYQTDGHDFLAYINTKVTFSPDVWGSGYGYGYGGAPGPWSGGIMPPGYTNVSCQTTFEVLNDHVINWTLRGGGC